MARPSRIGRVSTLGLLWLAACSNPLIDEQIEALGEEAQGVSPGPYHRAGQPCVLCHGPYFGSEPELSIGGTIFSTDQQRVPVEGAVVRIWDSVGETRELRTNCVGNFYVEKSVWDPLFPLKVQVEFGPTDDRRVVTMRTRIGREGSCASCHIDNKAVAPLTSQTQASPGRVYCATQEQADGDSLEFPELSSSCPGKLP